MRNKIQYIALAMSLVFALQVSFARALNMEDLSGSTGGGLNMNGTSSGGNSVYQYPSGTLLNDGGTIYLIRGAQKIPFATAAAFSGLGYSFANAVSGDSSSYTPNGFVVTTSLAEHPWGSWLSYKGTVYYLTSAGLVGVPSEEVLTSNGGSFSMVLPANKYDVALLKSSANLPLLADNDSRVYTTPTLAFSGSAGNSGSLNFSGNTNNTSPGQPLVVTAPVAGAQFTANSLYSITWTGGISSDFIKIDLVYQGSCNSGFSSTSTCGSILNIAASVPNVGSYLWLVPTGFSATQTAYQIKITDISQTLSPVVSPAFYVGSPANSIATTSVPTVLLTSAGRTLAAGTQLIGKMVVTAPSSTSVTLIGVPVSITTTGGAIVSGISFVDDITSQTVSTYNPPFNVPLASNATTTVAVNNDNIIFAGATKTYDITAPVVGTLGNTGTSSVALQINGQLGFTINVTPVVTVNVANPTNQVTVSN